MLVELRIEGMGVIDAATVVLGPGLTALTGETGAGKTILVEAINLLVGGRADGSIVRAGCDEARVEGRFVVDGDEHVVARIVPADGRSRGYIDGRLATAAQLAELGARTVDLHGQHAHQSLLSTVAQRAALDRFGDVDVGPLHAARRRRRPQPTARGRPAALPAERAGGGAAGRSRRGRRAGPHAGRVGRCGGAP